VCIIHTIIGYIPYGPKVAYKLPLGNQHHLAKRLALTMMVNQPKNKYGLGTPLVVAYEHTRFRPSAIQLANTTLVAAAD